VGSDVAADRRREADFVLEIPDGVLTPSNNRELRKHWSARYRESEDWFYRVKLAAQNYEIPRQGPAERRVVCVLSFRVSPVDPDNLAGGLKQLLDAMRAAELISNDREADIELPKPVQVRVRHKHDEKTLVVLVCPDVPDEARTDLKIETPKKSGVSGRAGGRKSLGPESLEGGPL
jgi:hypothetical protein